ncbi:MAG: hypothetical protein R2941_17170 [Desulfobacterales bacterium]
MKTIKIIDCTLRDGEQAPGLAFGLERKNRDNPDACGRQAWMSWKWGIPQWDGQSGNPSIESRNLNLSVPLCWCRAVEKDIDMAKECRTGRIHISFPVSGIHHECSAQNEKNILNLLEKILRYALCKG